MTTDRLRSRRRADRRDRDRRHRQRLREGRMTALVELDGLGLDWLVGVHALDPKALELTDMAELRRAVGEAISELIKVSARI
jgi:hypothetical protein